MVLTEIQKYFEQKAVIFFKIIIKTLRFGVFLFFQGSKQWLHCHAYAETSSEDEIQEAAASEKIAGYV